MDQQQIIDKLNELANLASAKGLRATQTELAASQAAVEDSHNLHELHRLYFSGLLYDVENILRTTNPNDNDFARYIRNAKGALIANEALIRLFLRHIDEQRLSPEKERERSEFIDRERTILENIENHQMALRLDQLLSSNQKYIGALKYILEVEDADLPPAFIPEQPTRHAANAVDPGDDYSATTKRGFFSMFSKLLRDLGNPNKDIQSTMMSFIGGLVEAVVSALAGLFKGILGADTTDVAEFAGNAKKAFSRYVGAMHEQEPTTPSFLPTFEQYRHQQAEAAAQQQAVPQQQQEFQLGHQRRGSNPF